MPQHGVWRVPGGSPCHRWGLGVLLREMFSKYKLWEGHFWAMLRAQGGRRLKRLFIEIGKKGFCLQKRLKRFERLPRKAWIKSISKVLYPEYGIFQNRVTVSFNSYRWHGYSLWLNIICTCVDRSFVWIIHISVKPYKHNLSAAQYGHWSMHDGI